ncbi:MAG: hypothetical protein WCT52_00490 [Candidatus Micrarchaeia archaeon]
MYIGIIPVRKIEGMAKKGSGWDVKLCGKETEVSISRIRGNLLFSKMLQKDVRIAGKSMETAQKNEDLSLASETRGAFLGKYSHLGGEIRRELSNTESAQWLLSILKGSAMGLVVGIAYFVLENSSRISAVELDPNGAKPFLTMTFNTKGMGELFKRCEMLGQMAGMVAKLALDAFYASSFRRKAKALLEKVGIGSGAPQEYG